MSALTYSAIPCVRVRIQGPHAAVIDVMQWMTKNGCYGTGSFSSEPVSKTPGHWRSVGYYPPDEAERIVAYAKEVGAWEEVQP